MGLLAGLFSLAVEKAYHAGLTAYYKSDRTLGTGLFAFNESWAPFNGQDEKGLYTFQKGQQLISAYHERYYTEDWKYLNGEQPFALEIPGAPLLFVGIIDGIGREKRGEELMSVMEWKSTKSPWDFCCRPNGQVVGYPIAMRTQKYLEGTHRYL